MKHTLPTSVGAPRKLALLATVFATLAGCGGSGEPDVPFTSAPITVTGTAATSTSASANNAIAGASVTLDCRNGHGIAMTDATGSYSVTTTGLTSGPCVVTATTSTGVLWRSLAAGDGSRANITPLTEMLYQYVSAQAGVDPRNNQPPTLLASSNKYQSLMASALTLSASLARVTAVIQANTVAPSVIVPTGFLTATLVAKTATAAGNEQSLILDQLRAKALTTVTGQAAATAITAAGQPSAQILLRLDADAKLNLLAN